MFRNQFYYRIKPLLPSALRLSLRRWFTRMTLKRVGHIWPILPGSERPPRNWRGWPQGKKFAFVLTHDVEGLRGLERCRQLMRLDMAHGFRSSFNFIPEGAEYRVASQLREEIVSSGFEVGVHDLHHDGRLYWNRRQFNEHAGRINRYLKEWNATGFRSGFMHHDLDWLHDLEIQYDSSTFDTDPFEPQPDGVNTIFPFWISNPASGAGYVEMPYTLAQDHTLFVLLKETSPRIWTSKLDWIAQHGGLALVCVHPDYIAFDGEKTTPGTFPVDYYIQFLEYVRSRYAEQFWQPLPNELAKFIADLKGHRLPVQKP